eukprot:TRINITY_DN34882_c0_g2_i1.p1 TRINITY_DN34882_c0_g2~~TRINITY_DN34882_c0_g2_i1.p1  ORF type:complete len:762 (+),score=92.96 TRINITY_DN34882_c0_g2_i1:36-2288(+)
MVVCSHDVLGEIDGEGSRKGLVIFYVLVPCFSAAFCFLWLPAPESICIAISGIVIGIIGVGISRLCHGASLAEKLHAVCWCCMIAVTGAPYLVVDADLQPRLRAALAHIILWNELLSLVVFRPAARTCMVGLVLACGIAAAHKGRATRNFAFSAELVSILVFGIIFFVVGLIRQRSLAILYKAKHELVFAKAGVEKLVSMAYDSQFGLGSDGNTILHTNPRTEVELSKRGLDGNALIEWFAKFQAGEVGERSRFHDAIVGAQKTPVTMSTTFTSRSGGQIPVELFIMRHWVPSRKVSTASSFLVAIRFFESDQACPMLTIGHRGHDSVTSKSKCDSDCIISGKSAASSTSTGRALTSFAIEAMQGDVNASKRHLSDVAARGIREHWLIPFCSLTFPRKCVHGVGGFGLVLRGRLHETPVAVKVRRTASQNDSILGLLALLHEARALRYVRHPNVVLLFGVCIDLAESEFGLVCELVQGRDLGRYIAGLRSPPHEMECRLCLAQDVCRALRFVHGQDPPIVHSDLKSSNVMVEEFDHRPRAKLIDFGLSRLVTRRSTAAGGTVHWVAPEVICCPSTRPSPSSDVFSFGRLLFSILTGQQPLAQISETAIVDMVFIRCVPPLAWPDEPFHCSTRLRNIAERCLLFDPGERPGIVQVDGELSRIRSAYRRTLGNDGATVGIELNDCSGGTDDELEDESGCAEDSLQQGSLDWREAISSARERVNSRKQGTQCCNPVPAADGLENEVRGQGINL